MIICIFYSAIIKVLLTSTLFLALRTVSPAEVSSEYG
jgi:hypothetical protein